jgi:hypothetical protein
LGEFKTETKMFLIVFTTLMLSITAVFAQVATLQTAQVYHAQNALAQTMITWHSSAVAMIHANIASGNASLAASTAAPTFSSIGCTFTAGLTPIIPVGTGGGTHHDASLSVAHVQYGHPNSVYVTTPTACISGGNTLNAGNGYLMGGYNTNSYKFYTLAYKDTVTGYKYVVTFAHDTDAGGDIVLPDSGGVSTSYTLRDLIQQLTRSAPHNAVFGYVLQDASGQNYMNVPASSGGGRYDVPDTVPVGSVAIVSLAS